MTRNYGILCSAGNSSFSFDLHGYVNDRFVSLHAFVDNATRLVRLDGLIRRVKESLRDYRISVVLFFEPTVLYYNSFPAYSKPIVWTTESFDVNARMTPTTSISHFQ